MPETIARAAPGMAAADEPGERECMRCYIGRMVRRHGCDNTRRWTIRWRDRRAPGDEGLLEELENRGGICCDCEVLLNVWEQDDAAERGEQARARPPEPCRGAAGRSPLGLCARWAGWSLRDPDYGYGYDAEDHYEDEDPDAT